MSEPSPARLPRPRQLDDLSADQLVAVILRLTMELSCLRERLQTQEQLLVKAGVLDPGCIDAFQPDADDAGRRNAERQKLIDGVIRDLGGTAD